MAIWYDGSDRQPKPLAVLQAEQIAAKADYEHRRRASSGDWIVWAIIALGVVIGLLAGYGAWTLITQIGR